MTDTDLLPEIEPDGCLFCSRTTGPHERSCAGWTPPVQPDLMAVSDHKGNAELVRDCLRFYAVPRFGDAAEAIDTTWGKGLWWKGTDTCEYTSRFVGHAGDMRNTGEPDQSFDLVFYDPPYISVGGRATTTVQDFFDRFGLGDAPTSPHALQILMNEGLDEACRIVRPKGLVFMKCANYVSSGKLWTGVTKTIEHALTIPNMRVFDLITHRSGTGPQPLTDSCSKCDGEGYTEMGDSGEPTDWPTCPRCDGTGTIVRRKVHARNNASVMIILEKGGRRAQSKSEPADPA